MHAIKAGQKAENSQFYNKQMHPKYADSKTSNKRLLLSKRAKERACPPGDTDFHPDSAYIHSRPGGGGGRVGVGAGDNAGKGEEAWGETQELFISHTKCGGNQ